MTAGFLTPLVVEWVTAHRWRLTAPLVYRSASGRVVTVPADFVTDFASFGPLRYRCPRAATLHDYLYFLGEGLREEADAEFRDAMECDGVPDVLIHVMHGSVRTHGEKHWRGASDPTPAPSPTPAMETP